MLPPGFIKEGNGSEQLFGEKAAVFQRTVSRTCFNLGQKIPDAVKGTKDTPEVVNLKFQRKQLFCIESVIKLAKVREGRSIPLVNAAMIEQWERYQELCNREPAYHLEIAPWLLEEVFEK